MSTFKMCCPFCKHHLEAEKEWIGLQAECPSCQKSIQIEPPKIVEVTSDKKMFQSVADLMANVSGLDSLQGFSFRGLFSEVFSKHTDEDIDRHLSHGTFGNTPEITDICTDWPKPWMFIRILIFMGISMLLLHSLAEELVSIGTIISFYFIGSFLTPVALTVLFYEMNARKNIPLYTVMKAFLVGGLLSLFITIFVTGPLVCKFTDISYWGPSIAGITEETAKLLAVIVIAKGSRYHYILNGLLLGAAVGGGFAAFENFDYITRFSNPDFVLIFRNMLQILACHSIWSGLTAGALWRVKGNRKLEMNMFWDMRFLRGFAVAVFSHMLWNSDLFIQWTLWDIPVKYFIIGIVDWLVILCLIQSGLNQLKTEKEKALKNMTAETTENPVS